MFRTNDLDWPGYDSLGRLIAGGCPVGLGAFWQWAANTKIIDEYGRPLVVYHGTGQDFDSFNGASYLTKDPWQASDYAFNNAGSMGGFPCILPVYLSMQNPALVDDDYIEWAGYENREISHLIALGYDGMINLSMTEIVVFDPGQVKSAIGNVGVYRRNIASLTDGPYEKNALLKENLPFCASRKRYRL